MKWKEWHDDIEYVFCVYSPLVFIPILLTLSSSRLVFFRRLSVSPLVMSWSPELKRVLNVLRGDNKTLADITNTWYELLVAKFLFQDPRITTKAFYTHTSTGSALVDECLTLKQMGYVATRQRDDDVIHSSLINEILLHIFTTDVRLVRLSSFSTSSHAVHPHSLLCVFVCVCMCVWYIAFGFTSW